MSNKYGFRAAFLGILLALPGCNLVENSLEAEIAARTAETEHLTELETEKCERLEKLYNNLELREQIEELTLNEVIWAIAYDKNLSAQVIGLIPSESDFYKRLQARLSHFDEELQKHLNNNHSVIELLPTSLSDNQKLILITGWNWYFTQEMQKFIRGNGNAELNVTLYVYANHPTYEKGVQNLTKYKQAELRKQNPPTFSGHTASAEKMPPLRVDGMPFRGALINATQQQRKVWNFGKYARKTYGC